ncbi:MAG TPA: hypothetical protein VF494_05455 [Candidatus Limnocylindrales bacterium]
MDRDKAWDLVWEALPAHWIVGGPNVTPGPGIWSVSAIDARSTGRGKLPRTVNGTGLTEVAALLDLNDRLRGVPKPSGTQLESLRRALRLAYVGGAEDHFRTEVGRPLSAAELERIIERFPG